MDIVVPLCVGDLDFLSLKSLRHCTLGAEWPAGGTPSLLNDFIFCLNSVGYSTLNVYESLRQIFRFWLLILKYKPSIVMQVTSIKFYSHIFSRLLWLFRAEWMGLEPSAWILFIYFFALFSLITYRLRDLSVIYMGLYIQIGWVKRLKNIWMESLWLKGMKDMMGREYEKRKMRRARDCATALSFASIHKLLCLSSGRWIYWCRGAAKCAGKWARPSSSDVNHLRPRQKQSSNWMRPRLLQHFPWCCGGRNHATMEYNPAGLFPLLTLYTALLPPTSACCSCIY